MERVRPASFSLRPALPIPPGQTENSLRDFVTSIRVADGPEAELRAYAEQDFRRFVYTWGLAADSAGPVLELGANPYFTTMLLRAFGSSREITLANYFSDALPPHGRQDVTYRLGGDVHRETLAYDQFNVEADRFPYPDDAFDVVLFCEIIEHMVNDPLVALREIRRVLRPGGRLVLSTPNVNRLENVARMIAGANIYDPYSGYGPYGRHNREYNKHELNLLLRFCGFVPSAMFTADVHDNVAGDYADVDALEPLVRFRENDLGQYIFVAARSESPAREGRPSFLYRSYPPDELVEA
jgi:SAM-dependent methyltransferase